MFQLRFITQVSNPTFTSGNVCPTLRVWGVPTWFEQVIRTRGGGGAGCWGQSVHRWLWNTAWMWRSPFS